MFCKGWEIFLKNFVDTDTGSEQFENLPGHDTGSFESRSSPTNFGICDNVFIDFNSHGFDNYKDYLNFSDSSLTNSINISVENNFIFDCVLNGFSSDQILQLKANASAKHGVFFYVVLI